EVNHGVLADPRVHVTLDDGRNFLLVTPRTYDIVSVDTLDPKHAGNGNLYTREFYELSRRVLRPGGIFVQWLPYHQVDNPSLKMIATTLPHGPPRRHPLRGSPPAVRPPRAARDRPAPPRGSLPHPRHPAGPRRGARCHPLAAPGELHHAGRHLAALCGRQLGAQYLRSPS